MFAHILSASHSYCPVLTWRAMGKNFHRYVCHSLHSSFPQSNVTLLSVVLLSSFGNVANNGFILSDAFKNGDKYSGTTHSYFDIYSFALPQNVLAVAGLLGIYKLFKLCNCWNSC